VGLGLGGWLASLHFQNTATEYAIVVAIWSVVAAIFSLVSISFRWDAKLSTHENLFREFGELEAEFAALNTRVELGDETPAALQSDLKKWEVVYYKLEAKQPSAYRPLWRKVVRRVRREKWGQADETPKAA